MLKEKERLDKQVKNLNSKISKLPDGNIICSRNGKYYKWYNCIGKQYSYIPKKNKKLAEQLVMKQYLTQQLENTLSEQHAVNNYLESHANNPEEIFDNFCKNPAYKELISPYFKPLSHELYEWMNSDYETNTYHSENLIHKTISGNMVRSKSEAMIDMVLHLNKVPFRYECLLNIGGSRFFPDFTIRHPQSGEFYYWEHFGLMDEPDYYVNAYSKLHDYTTKGIIPGINLIATFETKSKPLNLNLVERFVEYYFL